MGTLYDNAQKNNALNTNTIIHNQINDNTNNIDVSLTKNDIIFILNKLRNCKIYGKQTEYFYNLILKLQKIYNDLDDDKSQ